MASGSTEPPDPMASAVSAPLPQRRRRRRRVMEEDVHREVQFMDELEERDRKLIQAAKAVQRLRSQLRQTTAALSLRELQCAKLGSQLESMQDLLSSKEDQLQEALDEAAAAKSEAAAAKVYAEAARAAAVHSAPLSTLVPTPISTSVSESLTAPSSALAGGAAARAVDSSNQADQAQAPGLAGASTAASPPLPPPSPSSAGRNPSPGSAGQEPFAASSQPTGSSVSAAAREGEEPHAAQVEPLAVVADATTEPIAASPAASTAVVSDAAEVNETSSSGAPGAAATFTIPSSRLEIVVTEPPPAGPLAEHGTAEDGVAGMASVASPSAPSAPSAPSTPYALRSPSGWPAATLQAQSGPSGQRPQIVVGSEATMELSRVTEELTWALEAAHSQECEVQDRLVKTEKDLNLQLARSREQAARLAELEKLLEERDAAMAIDRQHIAELQERVSRVEWEERLQEALEKKGKTQKSFHHHIEV